MIVKIWPIKADYANQPGKVGGVKGLKKALDYIRDEAKVIVKQNDTHNMKIIPNDSELELENSESNTTNLTVSVPVL